MTTKEQRLLELLKERSFRRGAFMLSSGEVSDYYIDARMVTVYSEGAFLIGNVIYERCSWMNPDAIGGLQVGAVPIVTSTVVAFHRHNYFLEGFWVRNEVKLHGSRKRIEGNLPLGSKTIVVDDVVTSGESLLKAVASVQEHSCNVCAVVVLVDRLNGAEDLFRQRGIDYQTIFTARDFLE